MKKIIMFIFILWPSLIGAQSIDNYHLNITIQASGDTLVENIIDSKETLDYLETNLPLNDNLTLETVGGIKKNKTYDFTSLGVKEFLKTNKATTNDTNLYLLIPRSNDTALRIFISEFCFSSVPAFSSSSSAFLSTSSFKSFWNFASSSSSFL